MIVACLQGHRIGEKSVLWEKALDQIPIIFACQRPRNLRTASLPSMIMNQNESDETVSVYIYAYMVRQKAMGRSPSEFNPSLDGKQVPAGLFTAQAARPDCAPL